MTDDELNELAAQLDVAEKAAADLMRENARYLAALKAEACRQSRKSDGGYYPNMRLGGITFRVTRTADGTLQADEVE